MPTGKVKWFNNTKGYGFIEHQEGDVFVHYSSIQRTGYKTLMPGQMVTYKIETRDKGFQALDVVPIDDVPNSGGSFDESSNASSVG